MSKQTLMLMGNCSGDLGTAIASKLIDVDHQLVLVDRKTDPKVSFRTLMKKRPQKTLTYKLDLSKTSYLKIFFNRIKESFEKVQTIILVSDSIQFTQIESFSTHQLQLFYRRNILAFASVVRAAIHSSILDTNTKLIFVSDVREKGIISNLCEAGIRAVVQTVEAEIPTLQVVHYSATQEKKISQFVEEIIVQALR